jgi:hypothetical protein
MGKYWEVSNWWNPHQYLVNFLDGGDIKMLDTSQYYPILINTSQYYKYTVKNLNFLNKIYDRSYRKRSILELSVSLFV